MPYFAILVVKSRFMFIMTRDLIKMQVETVCNMNLNLPLSLNSASKESLGTKVRDPKNYRDYNE